MYTDNKRNYFTIFVVILFFVFSFLIIKSFFNDEKTNNTFSKDGSFSFIYDKELLSDKVFNEMYDETRTNKVVANKNFIKTTNDINKGKLFLKPSKMEYYFTNLDDNPKYYKFTMKNLDYLTLYKLNDNQNIMYFAILGSDLEYYTISISISSNIEGMSIDDTSWKENSDKSLGIYQNLYHKVIDEKCNVQINLPILFNDDKYSEEEYNELRDKIEESISIEEIKDFEYNYYTFNQKNIKLSNNVTFNFKDTKIFQYYSRNDEKNNVSFTNITYIANDRYITFAEIDDKDNYDKYLENNSVNKKEYNYKGINTYLLYQDNNVNNDGIIYDSILFNIDDHYYRIGTIGAFDRVNNNSIDDFINSCIDGVLIIK